MWGVGYFVGGALARELLVWQEGPVDLVSDFEFRASGFGFWVSDLGCRASGSGLLLRDEDLDALPSKWGWRGWGQGPRIEGSGMNPQAGRSAPLPW